VAGSLSLLAATGAGAANLEPVGTFEQPIFVTSDPTNPDRLLIVERAGTVRTAQDGSINLLADLSTLVSCCAGERGLLSIAPAPDFAASGRFYAAYTGTVAAGGAVGDIHVDAFHREDAGALVREPILSVDHGEFSNHNGGQLQLGPDGFLYVSVGDGGGGGDPLGAGQSLDTLLGKLLRIEPRPGESPPYAIPPGNPFATVTGRDEIWALGLRNPWRFSFDRVSGNLLVADVGQGVREEVNQALSPAPGQVGGAGANYGWNCREGSIAFSGAPADCPGPGAFTEPLFDYPHSDPGDGSAFGCSITGGYVVRDPGLGDLYGRYLYGDFCVGQLRSLDLSAPDPRATDRAEPGLSLPAFSLYSFGEDSCGRIYVASSDGQVSRLRGETATECPPTIPPSPQDPRRPGTDRAFRAIRVQIRVARRRMPSARILRARIVVRVTPCAGNMGRRVFLNQGGRRIATKHLDRRCLARFHRRLARHATATHRALFLSAGQAQPIRSRRLTIAAAPPTRQVFRTAAGRSP
jgi:hypothetical protein